MMGYDAFFDMQLNIHLSKHELSVKLNVVINVDDVLHVINPLNALVVELYAYIPLVCHM